MPSDSEQPADSGWRTRPNCRNELPRRSTHLVFGIASCGIQVTITPEKSTRSPVPCALSKRCEIYISSLAQRLHLKAPETERGSGVRSMRLRSRMFRQRSSGDGFPNIQSEENDHAIHTSSHPFGGWPDAGPN